MNLGAVCFHMTRFSHCSCHSKTVSNSVCLSEGATVTKGAGLTISVIMAPNRCSVLPDWEGCCPLGLLLIGLDRRLTHWAGRPNLGCF